MASPEAAAPVATAPGMVAGRYLLQRQLGRGAAKDVWLAHDLTLDRGVALARVSGTGAWERLRREARLTARLGGHRHIVTVHDVFEDGGTPCLVARYMTGGSLADRLERAPGGRLEPQEVIAAGREIADALAHAHAHGVVHRDVKPDNVWIDAEGEAALGDFGVAVAEGESAPPAGTPRYAAPEQTLGEAATPLQRPLRARRDALRAAVRRAAVRLQGPVPDARAAAAVEPRARRPRGAGPADPRAGRRPTRPTGRRTRASVARELDRLIARPAEEVLAPAGVVGRGPELERLRKALTQAWGGAARTVVIAGEPGIGKTTLLDALANDASNRGGVAVRGRGEPEGRAVQRLAPGRARARAASSAGEPDPALGPLLGAAAGAGGEEQRLQLYDAVADLLAAAAADAPLLVVLDDLHWADASSLRLLAHVVAPSRPRACCWPAPTRRARSRSPRCCARSRATRGWSGSSSPGSAPDAVRALLPAEAAPPTAELVPPAHARQPVLRGRAGAAAVGRRAPTTRRRARRWFPRGCARSCAGASSGSATRPARCSRSARSPGASRSPTSCAPAGVARAVAAAALDRGARGRAGRRGEPGHFAFAHGIVRDAVREALPERAAARSTRRSPSALIVRRDAGADVPAAQIAHHALAAARAGGDPQPAWETALEAAREAASSLGHAEAAAHYAEALEALALGAEAPAAERRATLLDLADATFSAGDIEAARRRYSQAAAAARRDGDADAMARAALGFSQVRPYGAVDQEASRSSARRWSALPGRCGALRAASPACWRSSSPTRCGARR